jgi:two-component system sensor histidine kinase YesM
VYNSKNVASESWYINACKLNGEIYTFTLENDKQTLYMARSVSNPYLINKTYGNGFMGVITFSFDISELKHQIQSAELTPSTRIFLTDSSGIILYSNNYEDLQTNFSKYISFDLYKGYSKQKSFNTEYQNQKYITSVNNLKYGWNLIAMIPTNDIAERMSIMKNLIFIETLISIILGISLSLVFSKNITEPIIKLALIMKSVNSKEYFDVFVETRSNDEVGMLYDSFNMMMKRINTLVEEVFKRSKLQKEAEFKALQAQINPHFLYNTLDSVSWLALCEGNSSIVTIVSSLAEIMRFNIKDPEDLVTIKEEINHVKNYISIQSIRYDNNFDIEYNFVPEILNKKSPKMILQPLIENAIIHGIEKVAERGLIHVTGTICGNNIVISVTDNGFGANVNELNDYLDGKYYILPNSDGFGIKNVNERIKMYFGEKYGLRYQSGEVRGVIAILTIPWEE